MNVEGRTPLAGVLPFGSYATPGSGRFNMTA